MDEVEFLTIAEIARRLRVSKMTIYRLCKTGEFPAVRIGRTYRVPARAVDAYLAGDAT